MLIADGYSGSVDFSGGMLFGVEVPSGIDVSFGSEMSFGIDVSFGSEMSFGIDVLLTTVAPPVPLPPDPPVPPPITM